MAMRKSALNLTLIAISDDSPDRSNYDSAVCVTVGVGDRYTVALTMKHLDSHRLSVEEKEMQLNFHYDNNIGISNKISAIFPLSCWC